MINFSDSRIWSLYRRLCSYSLSAFTKKAALVASLSFLPVLFLIVKNFVVYRRGWDTVPEAQYDIILWGARLLFTPAAAYYMIRLWVEPNRLIRMGITQLIGFITYSLLIGSASFMVLKNTLPQGAFNGSRDLADTIAGNSLALNLFVYVSVLSVIFIGEYFERSIREEAKPAVPGSTNKTGDGTLRQLIVKNGARTLLVPVNEIICFLADGPYIKIVKTDHTYLIKKPMYELQETLPGTTFLRVHRSCIVNIGFVTGIKSLLNGDYIVRLKNGREIRASRTYKASLLGIFKQE